MLEWPSHPYHTHINTQSVNTACPVCPMPCITSCVRNILRLSITSDLEMAMENISNSSFNSFSSLFMSVMITNHFGATKRQNNIETTSCVYLFSRTHKQLELDYTSIYIQGGPKKPDCFSDLITLWRLVLKRRAVCQNFCNFIEKKVQNWHFNEFKYSLLNLLKSSQQLKLCYMWPEHMDFTQFTLTYSETTVIFPQS